jgi:hypothetical protein
MWGLADSRTYACRVTRVARYLLVKHTKIGKIYKITIKNTKWPQNIPNGHKIYQMTLK